LGLILLAALPGPAGAEGEPTLSVGTPTCRGQRIFVTITLSGILDEEVVRTLESGLPARLIFDWQLWRQRAAWWDSQLQSGDTHYRIFYDVLEEHYDIFDAAGRRIATCEGFPEVREIAGREQEIDLCDAARLRSKHRYYVTVEARLEALGEDQIRDLEGWLSGGRPGGESRDLLSGLSRHAASVLREIVGLGSRTARGRSAIFTGWDESAGSEAP
jgi:hypothetical protein